MRDPRHILITGASSGLGAALALDYAAPGLRLSLHGRNGARLAQIAEWARKRGAEVSAHTGDVTDTRDMAVWIDACDKMASLDLVIANAGVSGGTAIRPGGHSESADQIRDIFAANVTGLFNTVSPALPPMIQRGRGQIAIVSSLAGFRGYPNASAYCASKAAARVYGEGLRLEMARHNVQVNVICPGFVKTPMTDVNRFPMPLIMSAERAASLIRKGLAANRGRIAFPWRLYALVRLLTAVPQGLSDFIVARTPQR
jgi:short-subunit dehydrogenase